MLMIIISHTFNGYPTNDPSFYYPLWLNTLHIDLWGGMGVGIFLFMSGFGLFTSLDKKESTINSDYILQKFKRLFEPYFIYWMVEIITLALFKREELNLHIITEIITFSIHPDVENWFFKVIVVTHFIMLALFKCRLNSTTRVILLFTFSFAYLFAMKHLGFGQWWYNTILAFPVGALVAHRYNWFDRQSPKLMSAIALGLMFAIYYVHMNTIVFHLAFVLFCIYAAKFISISNRLLYFIGFNSFIFYFIECPVMNTMMMFAYPNYLIYTFLSVLGTLILSAICIKCSRFFW